MSKYLIGGAMPGGCGFIQKGSESNIVRENALGFGTHTMQNVAMVTSTTQMASQASNIVYEQASDMIFKDIMTSIVTKSLYLDEEFVTENAQVIESYVHEYIDTNGGIKMLHEACRQSNTPLLRAIKDTVAEGACGAGRRASKKVKEGACVKESDNFEKSVSTLLDEEEIKKDKEYLAKREDISEDQIGEFVKGKVLDVIKLEKETEQMLQHIDTELDELISNMDVSEEQTEALKESYNNMMSRADGVDMTLFSSLFYDAICQENATLDDDDDEEDDLGDAIEAIYKSDRGLNDDVLSPRDLVRENAVQIDTDMCFAEAIMKYTVLEAFATVRLQRIDRNDIHRMCLELNKK